MAKRSARGPVVALTSTESCRVFVPAELEQVVKDSARDCGVAAMVMGGFVTLEGVGRSSVYIVARGFRTSDESWKWGHHVERIVATWESGQPV